MYKIYLSFFVLTLISACKPIDISNSNIVYVNIPQVINESSLATKEKMHLDEVKKVLEKASNDAQKYYQNLDQTKAKEARSSDNNILSAQWLIEKQRAQQVVTSIVQAEAVKLQRQKGYGIIISGDLVLASSSEKNITNELIAKVNNVEFEFSPLPVVNIIP